MAQKETLTLGQASCLVLGIAPTSNNRKESKEYFNNSRLAVAYIHGSDPMDPIAIGKILKEQNPFKYRSYPESLPTSRETSPEIVNVEDSDYDVSSENSCEEKFSKHIVLNTLKNIFHCRKPSNDELFCYGFITTDIINHALKKHFKVPFSMKTVSQWIGQDGWLGSSKQHRINNKVDRGRWGWIMRDEYQEFTNKNDKESLIKYIKYIKKTGASTTTIGYARKSRGNEPVAARVRLLQNMVNKLQNRGRCSKIFVSPQSNADKLLVERDVESKFDMDKLTNVKGNMQSLIERMKTNYKQVRLVVIDYAGLSTNFYDIQKLVRKYKQIIEIVIDTGNDFDIMTRYNILNNDNLAEKFNCRNAPIKRSL